jgi:hypothetical protein
VIFQQKRKFNEGAEPGDVPSVALRSPAMISEYLSAMQAKSFSKMSVLELQDRQIPGMYMLSSTIEDVLRLTLSGRELYSGHDRMDGIEELGHVSGFHCSGYVLLFLRPYN